MEELKKQQPNAQFTDVIAVHSTCVLYKLVFTGVQIAPLHHPSHPVIEKEKITFFV